MKTIGHISISIALTTACFAGSTDNAYNSVQVAKALGWRQTAVTRQNVCGGYFYQPSIITNNPKPADFKTEHTHIHSSGSAEYDSKDNKIYLNKHVVVKQPGRLIRADRAILRRDAVTHKITRVTLIGHVDLEEYNKHVFGQQAFLNLNTHELHITKAAYHLFKPASNMHLASNGWGQASYTEHNNHDISHLKSASYTTASPLNPSWQLSAKQLVLNQQQEVGHAYNMWIHFYHIPIFYSPYFSFPIGHNRKSGFLHPRLGITSQSGYFFSLPYYFNLAPNYDDTLTATYYSKRNILWQNEFRYLNQYANINFSSSTIFNDHAFQQFKTDALNKYPASGYAPYLNQLNHENNNRGYFNLTDSNNWSQSLSTDLQLNYVTDPYFFQDFTKNNFTDSALENQLLNQATLNYKTTHWQFTTLLQAYQTLHQINQTPVSTPYRRLPEFDLDGNYQHIGPFSLGLISQWTNFTFNSAFDTVDSVGNRLNLEPFISWPLNWRGGYILPSMKLDAIAYHLTRTTLPSQTPERNLPIFSTDAGIYLLRDFSLFGHHYQQTLTPRIYYLYVPYKNQNNLPIFDTIQLPFSYDQLFSDNSFTGFDRWQNANQMSFSLNTTINGEKTASQILTAGIGFIDYFNKQKVCLSNTSCNISNNQYSPLASSITFSPLSDWSNSLGISYNFSGQHKGLSNASFTTGYDSDNNHIANIGYSYINDLSSSIPASRYLTTSGTWPIGTHWQALGYAYYDLTNRYPINAFAGLGYNACGWAARLVLQHQFTSLNYNGGQTSRVFNNGIYIEFQLKGLGSVGDTPVGLTGDITNYQDSFSQNF